MNCWCKLCRKWVYEEHFDVQYLRKGCGQGRDDIRYHPGSPRCGDVWRLNDGRYVVVDYVDGLCNGVTFSDGEKVLARGSHKYTEGVRVFLERHQAELISAYEDRAYPCGVDDRGWTDSKYKPDTADRDGSRSVGFLKEVLRIVAEKSSE